MKNMGLWKWNMKWNCQSKGYFMSKAEFSDSVIAYITQFAEMF